MDHLEAQDTLEGIVEWWVLERCIERRGAEVRGALAALTQDGFIVEKKRPGTDTRYQVNRGMVTEIRRLLAKDKNS